VSPYTLQASWITNDKILQEIRRYLIGCLNLPVIYGFTPNGRQKPRVLIRHQADMEGHRMNEKKAFRDVLIKAGIVLLFATLYSLGGAEFGPGKWLRRYVATSLLAGGLFWYSKDWRSIVGLPLLILGTSLGYGADNTFLKVIKRTYCGVILALGATSGDWLNKRFIIAGLFISFIVAGMVVLGVWNGLPDARTEEFVIGLLIALPIFSTRKR